MTGELAGQTGARSSNSSVMGRNSLILDMVMEGEGSLDYCVRYDSTLPVTAEQRDGVEEALERGANAWFSYLVGYDCFPYTSITVNVLAWATPNRDYLQWDDDGTVEVFVDNSDVPDCSIDYDMELRLEEGLGFTGFGENFGQWVDAGDYLGSLDGVFHIWLHEFGHGFGFPDYYDWDVWGGGLDGPNSVMVAGRAVVVTEWDGWMLRREYSSMKSRWQ